MERRRTYSREFKFEAVKLVTERSVSVPRFGCLGRRRIEPAAVEQCLVRLGGGPVLGLPPATFSARAYEAESCSPSAWRLDARCVLPIKTNDSQIRAYEAVVSASSARCIGALVQAASPARERRCGRERAPVLANCA